MVRANQRLFRSRSTLQEVARQQSREAGRLKIARRFNGGKAREPDEVPEGDD
jgi:hypothetical protein